MRERKSWDEIFQQLDDAGIPEDFLSDRGDEPPQKRVSLNPEEMDEMFEPTAPNLADPAERARLSPAAVRAYLRITQKWELSEVQARSLVGGVAAPVYKAWQTDPASAPVDENTMRRFSLAIAIFKMLNSCYSEPLANRWVRLENKNPLFAGQAPIEFMIARGESGMMEVRRLLDDRCVDC